MYNHIQEHIDQNHSNVQFCFQNLFLRTRDGHPQCFILFLIDSSLDLCAHVRYIHASRDDSYPMGDKIHIKFVIGVVQNDFPFIIIYNSPEMYCR